MTVIAFEHRMSAHCESGTTAALLRHAGMDVSEAMVFGVSGGLFFGYFSGPFFTFPTFVLRMTPGKIRRDSARRLGVEGSLQTFRDPDQGMAALDELIDRGVPVAAQVDFFYMHYIPSYARAHFNAHYVTVIGREEGRYLISDIYHPAPAWLDAETLRRARFARGTFAPKGMLWHPVRLPKSPDWRRAVTKGIRETCFLMLSVPVPFLGVRGIRRFADRVLKWPELVRDDLRLSHEVMMIHVILEERGTGGGGFRFLYAAFLQEAARVLESQPVADLAARMMANGDRWREISLFVARIGKNRDLGTGRMSELRELILQRATEEEVIFRELRRVVKR